MVEPLPPGHLLVLRPRRPDPTPPARALPPSRARRSRGRLLSSPLLAATAVVGAALLLVAQSAAATQASYQITALKQEQARLLAEQDQLQAQLAQAQAPSRVAAAAQTLGLGQPAHWQYLHQSPSPIALAPATPASDRTTAVRGVLAVLATLLGAPAGVGAESSASH